MKKELFFLQKSVELTSEPFQKRHRILKIENISQIIWFGWSKLYRSQREIRRKRLIFRLKISRKGAKESKYWLRLLHELDPDQKIVPESLLFEIEELRKILSAIITKTSK